jgi:hypothetical protein
MFLFKLLKKIKIIFSNHDSCYQPGFLSFGSVVSHTRFALLSLFYFMTFLLGRDGRSLLDFQSLFKFSTWGGSLAKVAGMMLAVFGF